MQTRWPAPWRRAGAANSPAVLDEMGGLRYQLSGFLLFLLWNGTLHSMKQSRAKKAHVSLNNLCHYLPHPGIEPRSPTWQADSLPSKPLLLSRFSRVWLCVTPEMAAHQAPPSLGFSRQEHWSGLPLPSPVHESEKWKGSRSVVSDSSQPHWL